MPKRDWLGNGVLLMCAVGVLFFLGLCALGVSISEYAKVHEVNAAYQKNAEEDREDAAKKVAEACKQGSATFEACITQHLETYYRDQATNQDLAAQKDMAYWAAMLFGLGIFQAILSLGGVYLVYATLTKTAEGLNLANKAIVVENRPWLYLEVVGHSELHFLKTGAVSTITVKITNVGNNPAQRVNVDTCPIFFGSENPHLDMERWAENAAQKYKSEHTSRSLFPKVEMATGVRARTPQEMIDRLRSEGLSDMVSLVYAVAVFYTSDIDDSAFYTVGLYVVGKKTTDGRMSAIPYKIGTVHADDLVIDTYTMTIKAK